jgi:hypothetical protein
MALVNFYLGSFASDGAANAFVAATGWVVAGSGQWGSGGGWSGAMSTTLQPGLQYYNTTDLCVHTYVNATVGWVAEERFRAPAIATADDATPTVLNIDVLNLPANAGPLAITNLDNAVNGQVVTLITNSAVNTPTIADAGNFRLTAGWAPGIGDTLTVVLVGAVWYEIMRANN